MGVGCFVDLVKLDVLAGSYEPVTIIASKCRSKVHALQIEGEYCKVWFMVCQSL